jgi:hypothetical protein
MVFRLVEKTGGMDYPYLFDDTHRLGGAGSSSTAHVISTDSLLIVVHDVTYSDANLTICENQLPYDYYGTEINAAGDYELMFNVNDNIEMRTVHVEITPVIHSSFYVTTCNNAYTWDGTVYTTDSYATGLPNGTPIIHTYTSASGCDSIVSLYLRLNSDSYTEDDFVTSCDSYTWSKNDATYTQSGTYNFFSTGLNGCDSTFNLYLTINNSSLTEETLTISQLQLPYYYNDNELSSAGDYTYVFESETGCDSIVILHLQMAEPLLNIDTNVISNQINVTNDFNLLVEGDALPTATKVGIDYEIYRNGVLINNVSEYGTVHFETYYSNINRNIGRNLLAGTGSIPANTFNVIYYYYNYFYLDFLQSTTNHLTANWNTPGNYTVKFYLRQRVNGTDFSLTYGNNQKRLGGSGSQNTGNILATSEVSMLVPSVQTEITIDTAICSDMLPFVCFGHSYDVAAREDLTFSDVYHVYDTIVHLNLHVNPSHHLQYEDGVCSGMNYQGYGFSLSSHEIDSLVGNSLRPTQLSLYHYFTTSTGCDSTVTLTLNVYPIPQLTVSGPNMVCTNGETTLTADGCDRYSWSNGWMSNVLTTPIFDRDTTFIVTGSNDYPYATCQNRAEYPITVLPLNTMTDVTASICRGDVYQENGFDILSEQTQTVGIVRDTIVTGTSACGIYRSALTLTVLPAYNQEFGFVEVSDNVCEGYDYQGFGFVIPTDSLQNLDVNNDATFFSYGETENGCDSITRLTLHVNPTIYHQNENVTLCSGDTYTDNLRSIALTSDTVFVDVYSSASALGCDSVVTTAVTVLPNPTLEFLGTDTLCYNGTLSLNAITDAPEISWIDHTGLFSSDSHELMITGMTASTTFFADVVLNGCHTEGEFEVFVRPQVVVTLNDEICAGNTYAANGFEFIAPTAAGNYEYQHNNTDSHGCDSVTVLNLTVNSIDTTDVYETVSIVDMPFNYREHWYNEAGTYLIRTAGQNCDMIIRLHLTVENEYGDDPFMLVDSLDTTTYGLTVYANQYDQNTKVAINYTVYKDGAVVSNLEDECGGRLNIATHFLNSFVGQNLNSGLGSVPTNTFNVANNQYDYFWFHFLNRRENRVTHNFTQAGDYEIVFDLLPQEGGVDYSLTYATDSSTRELVGGKNSTDLYPILATKRIHFVIENNGGGGQDDDEPDFPDGYPTLSLTTQQISALSSTDTLLCSKNSYNENAKVTIGYTIYQDDEPLSMLSNVASVRMETYYGTLSRYIGKNLTSGVGNIPANTFAPSTSYQYNYFYLHFLNSTRSRIITTWNVPGNYKIAFDLVEMTGGTDYGMTWTTGKRLGGKNAQSTGLLLATDTLYYTTATAPITAPTGLTEFADGGTNFTLYPNPTQDYFVMTLDRITADAHISITDVNGKLMANYASIALEQNSIRVNVMNWAQGVYFVTLNDGDQIITKKLVVTK